MEKNKNAILLVEDEETKAFLLQFVLKQEFPEHDIITAKTLSEAAEALADKNNNIVAATIDNGFPLISGGARKGSAKKFTEKSEEELQKLTPVEQEAYHAEKEAFETEQLKLVAEGGAGTMLVRFIRTGKTGAQSQQTLEEIGDIPSLQDRETTPYKELPIVWNSALAELGKIAMLREAIKGKAIDPRNEKFRNTDEDKTLGPGEIAILDDHAVATGKTTPQDVKAMTNFLHQQIEHEVQVAPNPKNLEPSNTSMKGLEDRHIGEDIIL